MNEKGWECPKCNAVMSPMYPICLYCKPKNKCAHIWGKIGYEPICINCGAKKEFKFEIPVEGS